MTKSPQENYDEPFFITEEIEAELIAAGYDMHEVPTRICLKSTHKVEEYTADSELISQSGDGADRQ